MFSLRIVSTSHYQAEPLADLDVLYSSFRSTGVRKVPVLRIFGATPAGQKTCMHVHGVFPYLYVPHDGSQPADGYMRRFAASLDKAINVANNSQANTQHVFKISLVAGIPMYGYHAEEQQFLKIYLYNPSSVRKAADLLLGGAVMNKSFQPHEAHIPFPLQLFIDYNLYGMNMINLAAVKFRRKQDHTDGKQPRRCRSPGRQAGSGDTSMEGGSSGSPLSSRNTPASSGSSATNTPSAAYWDMENIPSDLLLPASVERQSVCELEVDVVAADILNRREVTDNMGKNPGLAALWEDERQRRRDAGQPSQITPQQSQEHEQVEASVSERELLERFAEILQQQQALSRSNSEESEMSVEESTLSPEEVTCIPASQLEDHSQATSSQGDSQESLQSSQGTVVLGEEEEEEGAIISLESIQRVVSFSQSFSRPGSQPSSTPTAEGEAADQSLVDVLAALAEESSPSASQRCAAQLEALEDRDSVVGQRVAVPPDWDALQEDLEETLHMSQTLPEDRYDVEGVDATWDGSPKELKDHSPVDSDEAGEDDDDDDDDEEEDSIPQLDGASDQKPGSKKSGKKRLGVRGPVLPTTHAAGSRQRRGSSQGGDEDVPKGQSPPLSSPSAVHNTLIHSCDHHSSKSHPHNTSSSCSPQPSLFIADDAGDDDTDGAPLSSVAKALKESSQGAGTPSAQRQTADSCHPLSSVYSCAVSLQPLTASDSTGSSVKKNSPEMEDSDDSSDDNVPLIQIERQQKQGVSLLQGASASPKERTCSLSAEEKVSMEVCEKLSESHHQQESHSSHSGGSTSNSSECVVRMERMDTWNHSKKLSLSLNKLRHHSPDHEVSSPPSALSPPSSPHYFTIPLPTPVYKRLKMHGILSDQNQEVQCVRMYPRDASENDLQKIGCEIVSVNRLTQEDLNPTDIGVGRSMDEEGCVAAEEALTRQFGDSKVSESSGVAASPVQGVDKGRWAKHRRLMGPKCKRKTATASGIGHSATAPETVGICDKQETSGDGVHLTVPTSSESRAAPVHSSSTSVTCTTAAVSMASEDGRNAVGQQPVVSDCLSSVKGDSPCHKHPTCKYQSVASEGHVEDCSTPSHCASSSSTVGACKCEQLSSNNPCSCTSPWFPSLPLPVSTTSPSSLSASVPVPSSSCRKDCGGSPASCQSGSALCHGDDMDQRGSKVSTKDIRAGSPHSASTCLSVAFQSGHASCSSGSVNVMSVSSEPVALHSFHSNPITATGACGLQETLTSAATPVSSARCGHSPGMLHQSMLSPASQEVSECCSCEGSTSQIVRCLRCSGDQKSSPVLHQGSPKNPPVSASDVPCTGTSSVSKDERQSSNDSTCLTQQSSLHGNSTLPDRLGDSKTAVENDDDMHEKAESESENLSQNSELLVNSNSESNFCDKSQERTGRRNSASFATNKMSIEIDGEFLPFVPPMRHSSVQLWSLGDSDSETEDSEDSSDEYCPTAKAQKKKRKRKGSKQQAKRAKWSSVNNGSHSNSRCVGQDREKKHGRKGQHGKTAKTKGKEKTEQLIEGVHYIVVGKFKGHRIMLVKLERVKVDVNERVKVSDWQEKKTEGGVKTKPRLLGPRCRRLANGTSASDPSLVHIPKKEGLSASSDSESDASALQDNNGSPAVVLEDKPKTYEEVTMKPDESQLENGYVNTEELHQNGILSIEKLQEENDTVKIKKLQQRSSYVNIEKLEQQYIEELQRQNGNINIVELKQQDSNVNGDKEVEEPQSADKEEELLHPDKVIDCTSSQVHDISMTSEKLDEKNAVEMSCFELGELVARQRKRKKGLSRVSSVPCNLKSGTGKEAESVAEGTAEHPSEDLAHNLSTESHKIIGRGLKSACKNQAARKRPASSLAYSLVMSDDCENSQEGNLEVHSPAAVDIDTDSRMAASESTSRTQSPIPKTDLPFTISEHSQDADCSSLPQSNPNSTSSSPAFPHMALTCTDNKDTQEPCSTQTLSADGQMNTEGGGGEGLTSTPFCFQTMCDKVREVRSCHRPVDASSESSDSQEVHAQRTEENSLQSLSFSWKDKLQSDDSALIADMDKDKLKKQKKLSPNQRLGVAFLSKRRRKGKVKSSSVKSETSAGSSKVMDSLSLLHMATLASLEAEVGGKEDLKYPCTPWRIGSSKAEEKENHNVGMLQHLADNSTPWKTFSFSIERKEGECNTSVGVKSTLDPERSPDSSDGQTVEKKTKMSEEPSTLPKQDSVYPIADKPADTRQENRGGDDSSDDTDDYQISESTQNLREEKTRNKSHVKRKEISSENSDEEESRESESRSDNKAKDDSDLVRKRSCKMKLPLYEESDEKTDDYTAKVPGKQSAHRQMSGHRKRKVKRKSRGHKPENNKNKLLDSLDALHMATLASLGTDPPPPVHDDTMPRYSDSVWDHNDDYEESLIKMSYTSPVHSDLADLSPPLPLSPEDLSRVNLSQIQKQRTMPCRLKVDESRGTRIVCMAQVRAENAAERSSRFFKPIASPMRQESRRMNSAVRGVVQDMKSQGLKSPSVLCRSASKSAIQAGCAKPPSAPLTPVETAAGFPSHSTSCQTVQPTILNPQKLPTPTIPWHHPLHVITAWQECTLPDAAKDQYNSRKGSVGDSAVHASPHHSSDSVHHKDKDSSLSRGCDTLQPAAHLRTPPFSSAVQRENRGILPSSLAPMNHVVDEISPRTLQSHVSNLRRPSASYGPLGEIHNHGSRRLPFTSLAQMYAQRDRDCERSPSVSGEVSAVCDQDGGKSSGYQQLGMGRLSNTHPRRSEFHGDPYILSPHSSNQPSDGPLSWQSMSSRRKSEEILHGSTKSSPVAAFSHRDMHTVAPQPSPSGVRFHWSRSVDSGENREMRGQRVGEMRNQREGEVRSWREGEARNQSDGQARSHRWGEVKSQREVEMRSPREESVMAEKRTPTSCGLPMSTPTKWLSDISNTSTAGKPSPPSQQNTPVPHYSPRLSRTEMVISQMFNLESGSSTVSSSQLSGQDVAHSVHGDRWQNNKPGMNSSAWRSLHDVERESPADRLQQPPTTPLVKTPPSASWDKPAFSISTSSEHQLSPRQKSATPSLSSRLGYGENLPMGYSHGTQKSPVTSVYDRQVTSAVMENSPPGVMCMEKATAGESSSSVFSETSPMAMKSQPANWYQPNSSPLQFHDIRQDKSRSHSAYDSVHCLPESTQSYSGTTSAKWPEYSSQNHSSFMLNLSGLSEREKVDANAKSALTSGAEKNLYRSASWSSNVANTHVSEVNMAEPYTRSPIVSPPSAPVSTVTSSKSPGKGSPHSKLSENAQFSKPESWQQRNRKRSIGEYLEEMIESAYAKESPGKPPSSWSEVRQENCAYPIRSEEGSNTHTVAVNGLISSALDLTKCSGKEENTGPYVSGSLSMQTPCVTSVTGICSSALDMPSSYSKGTYSSMASSSYHISKPSLLTDTTIGMSHSSGVLPVSSSVTSHPTWTTIKTDDFENITDDEDEEVIPSSQGYTTGAYRFPGFRRLSSISSAWTPYSLHSAAVSKMPSQTSKDVSGGGSVAETMTPSHSYGSSNMYSYTKGGYSQCNGVSQSSKPIYGFGQSVDSYGGPGRESLTQQLERTEYGMVSSIGTPWKEPQTPVSAPTSTPMSQFEPITDSEDEEEGSAGVTHSSNMRTSQYSSSVPSSALSGSSFFPNHSVIMSSSAYSSVRSSAFGLMSTSAYPSLQSKALSSSSSLLTRLDSGISSASTGELKSSLVEAKSYSTDQPVSPSEGVAPRMDSALTSVDNKMHMSVFGDGGDRHDDSEPEDGGARKRGKKTNLSPSDRSSSAHQGPGREMGEKQKDFDKESGWQRNPKETAGQLQAGETSGLVLCPKAPPPSREAVKSSAVSVGLSVEPVIPAFCSHPPDLPDMPRELGGRVLRLPTNMVRELEELPPPGEGQGLGAWQSLKMAESPLLSSQQPSSSSSSSSPSSLSLRLRTEPQLRFVLTDDSPCVITPVRLPPSCSRVAAWLQDTLQKLPPHCSKTELKTKGTDRGGEAWGVEEEEEEGDVLLPLDIDAPEEEEEEEAVRRDSDEEDSMFTRLRNTSREPGQGTSKKVSHGADDKDGDASPGSSTPKRQRLDPEAVLHSTPVRRSSSDLFDVTCTPINDGQRGESRRRHGETAEAEFVTPKHPPLRRLSTNTQAALTKAVMTADQKQRSFEGEMSQIDAPTPKNTHGFKVTQQNLQDAKALHKHQFLTVLSMELHVDSRGDLMPDPEVDDIRVVFYSVFDDIPSERGRRNMTGAIVVDKESCKAQARGHHSQPSTSTGGGGAAGKRQLFEKCAILEELDVVYVESEREMLQHFAQLIIRLDPDILLGFEVQQMSWGFLLQRAAQLSVNLCSQISRIHGSKQGNRFSAEKDEWGADHTSEIHVEGRIVLNLWRLLRHEVTLNIYSFENCAFHILHRRVPAYTYRSLTSWYNHRTRLHAWRVVDYYVQRVRGQLAMVDQLDLIGKTSEFARVFGIEFYDVLSRGSQYRVESMMLRLAKPLNFIPVSPSVQQRARQKAAECIPLTLEPQSRMYTDPVVVLDFQSLYPSIMIAYNYCFSTCLGRLQHLAHASEGPFEFGCTSLSVLPESLKKIRKHVTISPNGCVFVTGKVRRGVLSMMVEEILQTRLMVKKSMKDYKEDKTLHRMLDARQLGLKLIANVTYGYTGASFSGRMPCIEVADSIVRKARESLERAIQLVEDTPHWRAEVVYGDTDSLFIRLPGRSKDEAFVLGQEIADTVTNMFPKPMKLKFEKVYLPCALQTKKRYVGFMYETRDQQEAVFDAKGIETVRRDNCGVASKVLERCIKIMFTQRDVSQVRAYLHRQLTKMLAGRVGLQDFVFAKEYRGMMGYKPGACVPSLEIAKKRLRGDRRAEPRVGERVPYVIVHGSPGLPLIQLVRQPRDLLSDPSLRINVTYYISKQVLPPLNRLLSLVGVSVFQWYNDMPKVVRFSPHVAPTAQQSKQGTISQYFVTSDCLVCERQTKEAVCASCRQDPQLVAFTLASRSASYEALQNRLTKVCQTCMGVQDSAQPCVSLDCPVLFRRHLATLDLARTDLHRDALLKLTCF